MQPWAQALLAVGAVSLVSMVGALTLKLSPRVLRRLLLPLVALAAGTMLGDAFLHLLPHAVEEAHGFSRAISLGILAGMLGFFLLEKVIHWRHEHELCEEDHIHPVARMNLIGDAIHNLLDGALIAGAFASGGTELGLGVAIAVALHEIPQEMGDFAVLMHGGYSPRRALFFNLLSALAAFLGAGLVFALGGHSEAVRAFLVPFTAGAFIYIAASDLIPEIRREERPGAAALLLCAFAAGLALMLLIPEPAAGHAH
ncbi:MAG: ZIP family metal transporter [Planctomycetaceae bacterium]